MEGNIPAAGPAVLVVAGTSSGVGKTTVACGLMAACALRGLVVQPFKVGPDFLDGMHHERAAALLPQHREDDVGDHPSILLKRKSINLDGWMMGSANDDSSTTTTTASETIRATFQRYARGADVCIVEGVMGLYDSKDGTSEDGSTAQIAKYLNASVLLVIDAKAMARSVAPMVLGYQVFDLDVKVNALVANNAGGTNHVQWIRDAVDQLNEKNKNNPNLLFVGGLPKDKSVTAPSRHLGLKMPNELQAQDTRFRKLAELMEANLDLDALLGLARKHVSLPPVLLPTTTKASSSICRIAVAQDEAFCFYYHDNLRMLQQQQATIVPFSPIHDPHLPTSIDAIYMGGGYPELHAKALQDNVSMRRDIHSFVNAGGAVYGECGGFMYLTQGLHTAKDEPMYEMCGVFDHLQARMTSKMKMHYATITFNNDGVFPSQTQCRGQQFHFGEVIDVKNNDGDSDNNSSEPSQYPLTVQPETILSVPTEGAGCSYKQCLASFYHLHFAGNPSLAHHFVQSAIRVSPWRQQTAVSFVSAATEIVFALGLESALAGVTSICDFPVRAQAAPRRVVCKSYIDAENMTSEEVEEAMQAIKRQQENKGEAESGPGVWNVDTNALQEIAPQVVFVQNTCPTCDVHQDDVMWALHKTGQLDSVKIVPVSPTTMEGMLKSIVQVAEALGTSEKGQALASSLRYRLQRIKTACSKEDATQQHPLRVLSLEGLAPPCTGGGWLPDMKVAAGCLDALDDIGGAPARRLSWEDITACDPDVLLLSPCSASLQRTLNELHLLASEPLFWSLQCVQEGRVYIIEHSRFSRPGPRLVEGTELLANLLGGVEAPSAESYAAWSKDVLKYECSVVGGIRHCTTELASRFVPVYQTVKPTGSELPGEYGNQEVEDDQDPESLRAYDITRCTIPGKPFPSPRSAHCMVSVEENDRAAFLVLAGEDAQGERLNDVWKLHSGSNAHRENPGSSYSWEWLRCGKVADEDIPTRRSNSAAVVCGSHLLVFGGWGDDSVTPQDACELLHLDTLCWTHCSTLGKVKPPPRGNPTMVYSQRKHCVILYGGWNRNERMTDLWCLDMKTWKWTEVCPLTSGALWPAKRTDHSSVLWEGTDGLEHMIVYGGTADGSGTSSEIWMLNCSGAIDDWSWQQVAVSGRNPQGRTAHTASIAGKGAEACMIIVGGTNSMDGCGKSGIVADAWSLEDLTGLKGGPRWILLPWQGPAIARCRHTMSCVGSTVTIWGGFDGEGVVQEDVCCWSVFLPRSLDLLTNNLDIKIDLKQQKEPTSHIRMQERWAAEIPVRESDLPPEMLMKARKSALPGAVYKTIHRHAVAKGRDTYIDPASGYSVFTSVYLKRRSCCGNGCRHCPYGHANVPGKSEEGLTIDLTSKDLEW